MSSHDYGLPVDTCDYELRSMYYHHWPKMEADKRFEEFLNEHGDVLVRESYREAYGGRLPNDWLIKHWLGFGPCMIHDRNELHLLRFKDQEGRIKEGEARIRAIEDLKERNVIELPGGKLHHWMLSPEHVDPAMDFLLANEKLYLGADGGDREAYKLLTKTIEYYRKHKSDFSKH